MDKLVIIIVYGLSYGFLLFFASVGMSMALGTMGVVNVAHGVLYMVGGYIGIMVMEYTGSWFLGFLSAAIGAGIVSLIIWEGFLKRLYKQSLQQVLMTLGWVSILANLSLWVWGPYTKVAPEPAALSGNLAVGSYSIPSYRLALIGLGLASFFVMWWLQEKTRLGAIVRAGMDDAEMVSGMGINLRPILSGVFSLGVLMAGMAALIGSPILGGINPWVGPNMSFLAILVAIVGGVGYVQGTLLGALIIGILSVIMATFYPGVTAISIYLLMVVVLLFKPVGLLGRKW
ncbi:MAG: branched-chain amino acid ABC transporter permease [Thermodesulfobacteriota bacterium]|jgi:branched-chain amino acid transport system permease protein